MSAGVGVAAKARFYALGGDEEPAPLERLRFFCSLAMNGQDWMDVEPFFDDVQTLLTPNARSEPTAPLLAQVGSTDGLCHTGEE